MDATTYPLGEILKPERRFMIPTFQRDYEWVEDPQWRLLFEDLEAAGERLMECRQWAADAGTSPMEANVSPHFLGAIVCDSLPFATGSVALRAVIDGQQRLSTLQLLIRGLLDVVQARDVDGSFKKEAASLRRMLRNPDDIADSEEETYKLWPRRLDRAVWPVAIGDEVPADGTHLYLAARRFFAAATRRSLDAWPADEADDRLRAMVDALSGLFKLVVIDLDPNDDAQVIFEVLNGRQTPLSAADLVKNLLFLRGELNDDEVERLYDQYWAGFDQPWWKTEVGTGHAARGRRDVLLSVWLNVETGRDVSTAHLYREARAFIDTDQPKTESVLMDLAELAQGYKEVYGEEQVADNRLRIAYDRLIRLNNLTAIPLVTWLRTLPAEQLTPKDHRRAVMAVESYTVRRMMVGWQTRGYGQIFTRALRQARAAADKGQDIPGAIIDSLTEGWPSDEDLQSAFLNRSYYGNVAQFRLRLVFSAIDDTMRAENPLVPNAAYEYDGLEIEHVMPQSWQDHWPLDLDPGDEAARIRAEAERNARVHRLGNLTMVTNTFNKVVSNLSWSEHKRPEFAKQASLELNKPIAASETWDEAAIDARAKALATVAARIWPSPVALEASVIPAVAQGARGNDVSESGKPAPVTVDEAPSGDEPADGAGEFDIPTHDTRATEPSVANVAELKPLPQALEAPNGDEGLSREQVPAFNAGTGTDASTPPSGSEGPENTGPRYRDLPGALEPLDRLGPRPRPGSPEQAVRHLSYSKPSRARVGTLGAGNWDPSIRDKVQGDVSARNAMTAAISALPNGPDRDALVEAFGDHIDASARS